MKNFNVGPGRPKNQADEINAFAFGFSQKTFVQIIQTQVADIGADNGCGAVGNLDGPLNVHAANGAARAYKPGSPSWLQGGTHRYFVVGYGNIGIGAAHVNPPIPDRDRIVKISGVKIPDSLACLAVNGINIFVSAAGV